MPLVSPSTGVVHVNRPLTNISVAFIQRESAFIAHRVFPFIPVRKQSDLFITYDRGEFNRDEMTIRRAATETSGSSYTLGNDSYRCVSRGHHKDIPDIVRANTDRPIQLDKEATIFLSHKALLNREINWAADFFVTGIWTNEDVGIASSPVAGTSFIFWNDAASTPIEDIRAAKRTILQSTGFMPNVMTLQRAVYDALIDHPDIVGRLDRGQTTGLALVKRAQLAVLFELDEILIMDAIQNSAAEGATNVHDFIGGKHALLSYRPAAPGLMTPTAGYTFGWTGYLGAGAFGGHMDRFRMKAIKSTRVEIETSYDQKLVAADLGFMFLNAVS